MYLQQTKILGLALLVGGLVMAGAGLRLLVSPSEYQAVARMRIRDSNPYNTAYNANDPTNYAVVASDMRSEAVLTNVISSLKLDELWGAKFGSGKKLTLSETVNRLRDRLRFKPVPRTKLTTIICASEDPVEAARLANTTAIAYHDFRRLQAEQAILNPLLGLEDRFQKQEADIVTARSNVNALAIKCGVIGPASGTGGTIVVEGADRVLNEQARLTEADNLYKELSDQLNRLKSLNKEKLRVVLPTINPDGSLSLLLDKLHEVELQDAMLKGEYTTNDPVQLKLERQVSQLKEQIDIRVSGLLFGVETKVAAQKADFEKIRKEVEAENQNQQAYSEAKKQLDRLMDEHQLLSEQIKAARLDLRITQPIVSIQDYAEPSRYPVGPDRPLGALLLGVGLFPILAGWLLIKPR